MIFNSLENGLLTLTPHYPSSPPSQPMLQKAPPTGASPRKRTIAILIIMLIYAIIMGCLAYATYHVVNVPPRTVTTKSV